MAVQPAARPCPLPLPIAVLDREGAHCWRPACETPLVPLLVVPPSTVPTARFSGEWHRGDDHVWRLTAYARVMRKRTVDGLRNPVRRPRWSAPDNWRPVTVRLPCAVECFACGAEQSVRWPYT